MSCVALEKAINNDPIAVMTKNFDGSVNEINIKLKTIKIWENISHDFRWPKFLNGSFKLSTNGDQINLNEYAKAAQLNIVTVLLLTPAFTNHTDKVEKTSSIGKPEEKPKRNILIELILKIFLFIFLIIISAFIYSLQKDGKNKTSTANNSSLPRSIPNAKIHLDTSGILL